MIWTNWPSYWQSGLDACLKLGGDIRELRILPPADEQNVAKVEDALEIRLPESMRQVLLNFSRAVEYRWYLPDKTTTPRHHLFRNVFGCTCCWSLDALLSLEEARQEWIASCFPNANDTYDAVWHNKLAFMEVGNGDLIALDLSVNDAPVIYLSHDDGEAHGYKLANNFQDFINRWSLLGCPGPEDWQMLPFISSPESGLEPHCENAQRWREWFGLQL